MIRHYHIIFRELVFITSPSYISISIAAVGNTIKIKVIYLTSYILVCLFVVYYRSPVFWALLLIYWYW